jgi:hypothetical protein
MCKFRNIYYLKTTSQVMKERGPKNILFENNLKKKERGGVRGT